MDSLELLIRGFFGTLFGALIGSVILSESTIIGILFYFVSIFSLFIFIYGIFDYIKGCKR